MEAVLVSNGPGELYTWVEPVLRELRRQRPETHLTVSLIPCQFAAGGEAAIAESFAPDAVTTPQAYLRFAALGRLPGAYRGEGGVVVSLGGNAGMALKLARKLGYPCYRYSFVPYWHPKLRRLFVPDEAARRKARLLGAPANKLEVVGNLVADAVSASEPVSDKGEPHLYLNPGSRDGFAVHLIPLFIAVVDALAPILPRARFVWAVSRLLSEETIAAGIAGLERRTLGGMAGRREGDTVLTPSGGRIEMVAESARYAHMRSADVALTIPGTNTLELGIAGVPSVVMLPLNKPEAIPLEGSGHWLSLVPFVGKALKRQAVKLAAPRFAVSLPNTLAGEALMVELKGILSVSEVAAALQALLDNPAERARRRARLQATMPQAGAAARLVGSILRDGEL
jgi:lipid-A-disaccharide synthase